jgi:hypothetical protein
MADNFVKGIVYETNYWVEESTGRAFTKCLKCGKIDYLDEEHIFCPQCGEEYGDYHNEFIDAETVEKLAWSYLGNISLKVEKSLQLANNALSLTKGENVDLNEILTNISSLSKHHLGFSHTYFSSEFGYPVESEVERQEIEFNGVKYPNNIWKCGFIVNNELFEQIEKGEINSFSFGGFGSKEVLFETQDN